MSVISLDFLPRDEISDLRKQARQHDDEELLSVQNAQLLKRSKGWMTKQQNQSFAKEDCELPDGRQGFVFF